MSNSKNKLSAAFANLERNLSNLRDNGSTLKGLDVPSVLYSKEITAFDWKQLLLSEINSNQNIKRQKSYSTKEKGRDEKYSRLIPASLD